jgi:hypothetical protein
MIITGLLSTKALIVAQSRRDLPLADRSHPAKVVHAPGRKMSWSDLLFGRRRNHSELRPVAAQRNCQEKPPVDVAPSTAASESDDRLVRVFVSSTFLDMQTKRQVLVNEVFPALRAKYRARGVEIFEVDLRWGISAPRIHPCG